MFTLSGRMEAAQVPELMELFDRDLPKHHSGFPRPEAVGPGRSEVSKGLRGKWHEP